jgi:hypothetical protein
MGRNTQATATALREHFIDETPPAEFDEDELAGP